jgi:hypothetical protein
LVEQDREFFPRVKGQIINFRSREDPAV